MTAAPVLDVHDVVKHFGRVKALDGVSLAFESGEFVALLGPNGAGKTTLFQLLSGLFVPDSGTIRINGKDLRDFGIQALAHMGIVFQQPTLDLDVSAMANLQFHARLHGMGARMRERIAAELGRIGLTESATKACRVLSGGNRRRVELARALLHEPSLLLMDEATVGLDPASRAQLLGYVRELCEVRGLAVLWATHLVDEAEQAARVIVLHEGRVLTEGTPASMIESCHADSLAGAFLTITGESAPGSRK